MASDSDIKKLAENVSSLQQDMAQVGALVDRLDVTIEKLTEVSTTVSQLLAVQGNRLEFQEKVAEKLQDLVEKRRQETDGALKEVYNRIEKVEKDLQSDMGENHSAVLAEIKSLRADGLTQHKEMNDRIGRLEKWMWTLGGIAIIIALFLNKVDFTAIFK